MWIHAAALLWMAAAPAPPPAAPATDELLRLYAQTRRFRAGIPVKPKVAGDGSAAFFLRSGPKSAVQSLFMTDLATGQTREVLDAETLLAGAQEQLTAAERARLERQRISARGFTSFTLSRDGQKLLVSLGGRLYLVTRPQMKVTPLRTGETPIDPQFSPDGTQVAYVSGNDVYAMDLVSNRQRRLTRGGTEAVSHGLAEFVAQEEMDRHSGFWWSPDGKRLAFQETDNRPLEPFSIVDPMHPEQSAAVFPYPRAGKANSVVRLAVASAAGPGPGKPVWVQWDAAKYPYLTTVRWSEGAPLTVLVMNRAQNEEVLLRADPATGKTTALLTERSGHWLNLNQDFPLWKKDGSGFFWMTERNGGPEIELRQAGGAPSASWVPPALRPDSPIKYDPAGDALYFISTADPTRRQPYRAVKGGAAEALAVGDPQPAMVEATLQPESGTLVVTSRTLRSLTTTQVHRAGDLKKLADLPSVALQPPVAPATEIRAVGPEPRLYTSVTWPRAFQAGKGKKWPVLLYAYGGPTGQMVLHSFDPIRQWYADQGFIVVSVDNRGTPSRGSEFERAIFHDFSEVIVADQVAGLKALAAEVPELDLQRVGVHGWSFGGYLAALAAMRRPDAFKAAVAGAPVVDWRDYDTFYTERYLGLPDENRQGYDRSSLLTWAPKLERPLLIVHGTGDDNVYFFHSLKLSDALFRAGRPHRFLPLSGFTHMVPEPLVTERLHQAIVDFFRQTL